MDGSAQEEPHPIKILALKYVEMEKIWVLMPVTMEIFSMVMAVHQNVQLKLIGFAFLEINSLKVSAQETAMGLEIFQICAMMEILSPEMVVTNVAKENWVILVQVEAQLRQTVALKLVEMEEKRTYCLAMIIILTLVMVAAHPVILKQGSHVRVELFTLPIFVKKLVVMDSILDTLIAMMEITLIMMAVLHHVMSKKDLLVVEVLQSLKIFA